VLESHCLKHSGIGDISIVAVADSFWGASSIESGYTWSLVPGETVGAFVQRADNADGRKITAHDVRQHIKEFSVQSSPHWVRQARDGTTCELIPGQVWFLGENEVPPEFPKTAHVPSDCQIWAQCYSDRARSRR
jgi:acyl-CoA synthetase (AMP-forming)/AMP-acid ligase II